MQRIPLRPVPNQSLEIVLGGQNCTLRLYTRTSAGIAAESGVDVLYCDVVCNGVMVMAGMICQDMTPIKAYDYLPFQGQLLFCDMQGDAPPHWSGLDARWVLVWLADGETAPTASTVTGGTA